MLDGTPAAWEFTAKGLIILPDIGWDEWTACWEAATGIHRRSMFYIGDCLIAGEDRFGERYAQVVGDYAPETIRNAMWVARRIEPARRRPETLSFSVHQAVAALDPAEQDELLAKAEAERWRTADMKAAVKARKAARERYPNNGGPAGADHQPDVADAAEAPSGGAGGEETEPLSDIAPDPVPAHTAAVPAAEEAVPRKPDIAELRRCIEAVRALGPDMASGAASRSDIEALSHRLISAMGLPLPPVDRAPLSCSDQALELIPEAWRSRLRIDGRGNTSWVVELRHASGMGIAVGEGAHLPGAVCEAAMAAVASSARVR